MPKNTKKTNKVKKRSYKITDAGGRPCLKINGHFLATEYGFEMGSRVEVVQDGNVIVITKVDHAITEYQEAQKRRDEIKKEMQEVTEKIRLWDQARNNDPSRKQYQKKATTLMVAEKRSSGYTVDDELTKQPEKYSQA